MLTFRTADDETLVSTTKITSDSVVTTDVSGIFLHRSSCSDIDELGNGILLVD